MKTFTISDKAHVVALDDQAENLQILTALLSSDYHLHPFIDPEALFLYLHAGKPVDLILLDILMPVMDGYEVCRRLRENPELDDVPIIFLTGLSSKLDEERGLELGANDYITKPFSSSIVLARVRNFSNLGRAFRIIHEHNQLLEVRVTERTADIARKSAELMARSAEIILTQEATMLSLSSLAETRDSDTGKHIFRTQSFVRALAVEMMHRDLYTDFLNEEIIDRLYSSAALHDIGKVAIPDYILLKQGKLSPDEFEIMKTHAAMGSRAIEQAESVLGSPTSFLSIARDIAHFHHERWDGQGYPEKLSGEAIPLPARIMAIADVYDALTCQRVYKASMSHEAAIEIMLDGRGTHFDPMILDVFLDIQDQFRQIKDEFAD